MEVTVDKDLQDKINGTLNEAIKQANFLLIQVKSLESGNKNTVYPYHTSDYANRHVCYLESQREMYKMVADGSYPTPLDGK
jgi:hypothetical protein